MPSSTGILAATRRPVVAAGWSPLNLPNLVAWYDASDLATITASGGRVSNFANKANPGTFDMAQATSGVQPLSGSHTMNGLNTLYFSQARSDWMKTATVPLSGASAGSLLFVVKRTDAHDQHSAAVLGPGGGLDAWYPFVTGNRYEWFGTDTRRTWANLEDYTLAHQGVVVSGPGAFDVYHNGASVFSTGNTVSFSQGCQLSGDGADWTFGGDISEVVLCASAISSTDRTNWATYCARWGL